MRSAIFSSKGPLARLALAALPTKRMPVAATLHNVPEAQEAWLAATLRRIAERHDFAEPTDIVEQTPAADAAPCVLLTFDDGFASNRRVAENVLEPMGIKALFFVAGDFIGLAPAEARRFVQQHVYPTRAVTAADGSTDAMTWADVRWLASRGHQICAHTRTHCAVSGLSAAEKHEEIVFAADRLEQEIGLAVRGFAYPFGSVASIDEESVGIARSRFAFAFSNVRGALPESPSRHFLYRQNLVPGTPPWLVDAIIEGRLDWHYRKVRRDAQARFSERSDGR